MITTIIGEAVVLAGIANVWRWCRNEKPIDDALGSDVARLPGF